jgi:predicted nucleotidyltransferase
VRVLADTGTVSKIFLFGSYASGEENEDSDIDLCVLTPEKVEDHYETAGNFRKKILDVQTMPLDLLAFNSDEFAFHAKRPSSFYHEIAENGVLLYER